MTATLRTVLVALAVVAVLPALWSHRPLPPRVATVVSRPRRGGRSPPRMRRSWLRVAAPGGLAAGALAVVGAVGAVLVVGVAAAGGRARARAATAREAALLAADVPEVADLLVVAVGAGLSVPQAVYAVGRRATGPLAQHLAHAAADAAAGRRLADALDDLPTRAGESSRPLAAALLACLRDGAPVVPTLTSLAVEARENERRRVEQAARRVPVLLLFPLVLCILPAFALLTVAPLIADALAALRL